MTATGRAVLEDLLRRMGSGPRTELRAIALRAGLGDPVSIDVEDAARIVHPYSWLIARATGDGIPLTQAGYLPPAVVEQAAAALGDRMHWYGKTNREAHVYPVRLLRESAQGMRLVRRAKGRLVVSPAGRSLAADPVGLVEHLADHMLDGESFEQHAACLMLLVTAAGLTGTLDELEAFIAAYLNAAGWRRDGRALVTEDDARHVTLYMWRLLVHLGLVRSSHGYEPQVPAVPDGMLFAKVALGMHATPAQPDAPPPACVLRIELSSVTPTIWRRLVVPGDVTLAQLHELLQAAMGWQDYHLYTLRIGGTTYVDHDGGDWPEPVNLTDAATLEGALGGATAFEYDYDFGDGWHHTISVELVRDEPTRVRPTCLDGAMACPPEDVGGPGGYAKLLRVLADPQDVEHQDLLGWIGGSFDPELFDRAETNRRLEITSVLM